MSTTDYVGEGGRPVLKSEYDRIHEAYLRMAKELDYRPALVGVGGFCDPPEGSAQLEEEADAYARGFIEEEDDCFFFIGSSDFRINRGLVYTIEAARQLCTGSFGFPYAIKLLEMALEDVREAEKHELHHLRR